MNDPSTYWLTLTNAALGIVVLICCIAVGIGVLQEVAARRKKRAKLSQLDREVADLVASFQDGHAPARPSAVYPPSEWPAIPMRFTSTGTPRNDLAVTASRTALISASRSR